MDRLFDLNHPFFIPLWRRVAIVVACVLWAMVEAATGSIMWSALFASIGLYCGWHFFFNFHPRPPEEK
ncbi:hypothetical protein [Rubellimicrobium roseum]|uniref:DUF3329 domain-containing protein n=1 Tax=Rubellimicrobium roseum TaxID=687525 RepID=A0A5C4NA50_9RHOB|nr:hypothetical protein [Rubellimicrobium roseum]TNC69135.1 hypothetical protein FHG71_14105 [Rubellimicrobium roseum]